MNAISNSLRKVISVVLLCCLILTFTSCKSKTDDQTNSSSKKPNATAENVLKVPYSREDGINPFTCQTLINSALIQILNSGLYNLTDTYKPEPSIAQSATIDGVTVTVKISTGAKFSDGSSITADDVIYSFNKAKESVYYGTALSSVANAYAAGPKVVVFDANVANKYVLSCLTFPIVKENTAESSTAKPIGAGDYVYSDTTEGGKLTPNKYKGGSSFKVKNVELINTNDSEYLIYSLVIGNFNIVYDDLACGKSQRMNASTTQVPLNNLIYLGVNKGGVLADPKYRQCLSAIIDRDNLISAGLEGYGASSQMPFNPNWYAATKVSSPKYNINTSKKYVVDNASQMSFSILVNSDNNFKVKLAETLCSQLDSIGIKTVLNSVPYETYMSCVATGSYDIYIGEYKLTNDMNIAGLIDDEATLTSYMSLLDGTITCEEFMSAFNESQPFIPIGFRNGVLVYSRSIGSEIKVLPNNPYANLKDWIV